MSLYEMPIKPSEVTLQSYNDAVFYDGWYFEEGTEATISFSLTDELLNESIVGTLKNMKTGKETPLVLSAVENRVRSFARISETGTYQFSVATNEGTLITDKIFATYQASIPVPLSDSDPVRLLIN